MIKLKKALNRTIHWIIRERLPETIVFAVFAPVMYVSVALYYLKYLVENAVENPSYNFEISILSATIGGFVLLGGFLEKTGKPLKKALINVGKWFLTSTVFSSIWALTVPLYAVIDKQENVIGYWIIYIVLMLSMILAVIGFAWGISLLITSLWKIGKESGKYI